MVIKKGKFGISTSSTLKLGLNRRRAAIYGKDQFVVHKYTENLTVKRERNGNDRRDNWAVEMCNQVIFDGGLDCAQTCYSLNKRKRWLLPTLLEEAIYVQHVRNQIPHVNGNQWDLKMIEIRVNQIGSKETCLHWPGSCSIGGSCVGFHNSAAIQQQLHVRPTKCLSTIHDLAYKSKQLKAEEIRAAAGHQTDGKRYPKNICKRGLQRRQVTNSMKNEQTVGVYENNSAYQTCDSCPAVCYEVSGPLKLMGHRREADLTHKFKFGYAEGTVGPRLRNDYHGKCWKKGKGRHQHSKRILNFDIYDGESAIYTQPICPDRCDHITDTTESVDVHVHYPMAQLLALSRERLARKQLAKEKKTETKKRQFVL